jgi:GNAT superfamily N-acetyltransferase
MCIIATGCDVSDYTLKTLSIDDLEECISIFKLAYADLDVPDDEERCFQEELKRSLNKHGNYQIHFLAYKYDEKIVSFAGIAQSLFMDNSWELRWDTTHPDFQRQGLMGKLIDHRLAHAEKNTANQPGIIHVCSRQPSIYFKKGFKKSFSRGPENAATYCVRCINMGCDYKPT